MERVSRGGYVVRPQLCIPTEGGSNGWVCWKINRKQVEGKILVGPTREEYIKNVSVLSLSLFYGYSLLVNIEVFSINIGIAEYIFSVVRILLCFREGF